MQSASLNERPYCSGSFAASSKIYVSHAKPVGMVQLYAMPQSHAMQLRQSAKNVAWNEERGLDCGRIVALVPGAAPA
jgi:hypothetical protein